MRPKAYIASAIALGLTLSATFAVSQTAPLCGRVVTVTKSPAASAVITLRNRIANAGMNGAFCFQGIDRGEYDVIVQWKGIRFICHVAATHDNICVVPD